MHLPVKLVYEQVWWPQYCRKQDPNRYDIPPIEDAPPKSLPAMPVTYRLAGIDGEATEDRVENLADESQSEANLAKKLAIARVLAKPIPVSGQMMEETTGV